MNKYLRTALILGVKEMCNVKKYRDIESKVRSFLSDFSGMKIEKITGETQIQYDLGINGDDAEELLEKFFEDFDVDFQNFDWSVYFLPEDGAGLFALTLGFFFEGPQKKEPLYVKYLVRAAIRKRWDISE